MRSSFVAGLSGIGLELFSVMVSIFVNIEETESHGGDSRPSEGEIGPRDGDVLLNRGEDEV